MEMELERKNLRAEAEERLVGKPVRDGPAEGSIKPLEELTIHQEMLKIQNEELKRIQLELESTKAKYFELYDLAPVGYITLSNDLIVKEANLAASKLLGCERKESINKGLSTFVLTDCHESLFLHYRRLAYGHGEQAHTFKVQKKDGEVVLVLFESNLVQNGHVKGFRSILTDITGLKKAEDGLRQANEGLEEKVRASTEDLVESESQLKKKANQLVRSNAELMQFAYVASHDLQEPLRMVVSYLSLLERRYNGDLDPTALEYIHHAVQGGERMRELIDDLLAYTRVDAKVVEFRCVDMNAVVATTMDLLKVTIDENGADMKIAHLPSVSADPSQMLQVMRNLISNAIKFHGSERPTVLVSATRGINEWIFAVKDNGIGLKMDYAERIFQMFQRLNPRDEYVGTGVGLAIVKKIVERHGGRVWVESVECHGATFYFSMPETSENGKDCQ